MAAPAIAPVTPEASGSKRRRVGSLVVGSIVAAFAFVFLATGTYTLWADTAHRGSGGFVKIGSSTLNTSTYAIQSPLTGDGPEWLYGSTVFGTGRIRGTSQTDRPLFIGVARTRDVSRYLDGVGYATIQHLATNETTTHQGGAPAGPPSQQTFWAASTQGVGQQTLLWKPRSGDWSVVMMNTDASPGVELKGDLAGKLPILPWITGVALFIGVAFGSVGGWLIARGLRGRGPATPSASQQSQSFPKNAPIPAHS